jgi:hypothetical protein
MEMDSKCFVLIGLPMLFSAAYIWVMRGPRRLNEVDE